MKLPLTLLLTLSSLVPLSVASAQTVSQKNNPCPPNAVNTTQDFSQYYRHAQPQTQRQTATQPAKAQQLALTPIAYRNFLVGKGEVHPDWVCDAESYSVRLGFGDKRWRAYITRRGGNDAGSQIVISGQFDNNGQYQIDTFDGINTAEIFFLARRNNEHLIKGKFAFNECVVNFRVYERD